MTSLVAIAPADAHALTMVAILAFALGSLLTMFLVMARNGKRNADLDLPEFPEEEPEPDKKPTTPRTKDEKPPKNWEKDADWWK
ncbi:MAG: hypothetical protein ACSHYB_14165 [Roseibacillus sp.]